KTDLIDLLEATVEDRLGEFAEGQLEWDPRPAVCVVMASEGYPGRFARGRLITGLDEAAKLPNVKGFHAGTKLERGDGRTHGGRGRGVTARGERRGEARQTA